MKPIVLQRWDSSQTESKQSVTFVASGWNTLLFFAGLHVTKGDPHSGILVKSTILGFVIWNVAQGVCNHANNWNPKSNLNRKGIRNPLLWMQNPWRGILNLRLSWIPLHEANILLTFDQKGEGTKIGLFIKRRSNLSAKQPSRVWSATF